MVNNKLIKFVALTVVILATIWQSAEGQRWKLRRYEAGIGVGMTQIFGDMGGSLDANSLWGLKDIKFDETSLAFPLYIRYKLAPLYSVKAGFTLGFGHAEQAGVAEAIDRSYKTTLVDFSVQGEYYLIAEEKRFKSAAIFNRRGMVNNYASFAVYGLLGIGGYFSNSNVYLSEFRSIYNVDRVVDPSFGAVVPFGVGAKYIIDDRMLLNAELGYRYCFSDYVEGYQQTLNSKANDVYYFLTLSLSYKLETSRNGLPSFFDKEYRKSRAKGNQNINKIKPKSKKAAME